jgi:hypothetical protein
MNPMARQLPAHLLRYLQRVTLVVSPHALD